MSRRGGPCCWLLDCLCECGCCVLSCIFKIIFSILVTIALVILVIWLIVRPHAIEFHATDAILTTFNFTSTNILNYDLAVNLTARNPNRHFGVYYDQIQANLMYAGQRLQTVEMTRFYQDHENTTSFGPVVFKGLNLVQLKSDDKVDFDNQSQVGVYDIEVKFHLKVKFKVLLFKTRTWKPKVKCELKVPLVGKSSIKFQETNCHYYF